MSVYLGGQYLDRACPSTAKVGERTVECEAGRHAGSHIALVDGEPVFWGRGLKAARS